MQLNTMIGCLLQSTACMSTGINLRVSRKNKSRLKLWKPEWVFVKGEGGIERKGKIKKREKPFPTIPVQRGFVVCSPAWLNWIAYIVLFSFFPFSYFTSSPFRPFLFRHYSYSILFCLDMRRFIHTLLQYVLHSVVPHVTTPIYINHDEGSHSFCQNVWLIVGYSGLYRTPTSPPPSPCPADGGVSHPPRATPTCAETCVQQIQAAVP